VHIETDLGLGPTLRVDDLVLVVLEDQLHLLVVLLLVLEVDQALAGAVELEAHGLFLEQRDFEHDLVGLQGDVLLGLLRRQNLADGDFALVGAEVFVAHEEQAVVDVLLGSEFDELFVPPAVAVAPGPRPLPLPPGVAQFHQAQVLLVGTEQSLDVLDVDQGVGVSGDQAKLLDAGVAGGAGAHAEVEFVLAVQLVELEQRQPVLGCILAGLVLHRGLARETPERFLRGACDDVALGVVDFGPSLLHQRNLHFVVGGVCIGEIVIKRRDHLVDLDFQEFAVNEQLEGVHPLGVQLRGVERHDLPKQFVLGASYEALLGFGERRYGRKEVTIPQGALVDVFGFNLVEKHRFQVELLLDQRRYRFPLGKTHVVVELGSFDLQRLTFLPVVFKSVRFFGHIAVP